MLLRALIVTLGYLWLLHMKSQVSKILVFCNMHCFIMFVTAVCVFFLNSLTL